MFYCAVAVVRIAKFRSSSSARSRLLLSARYKHAGARGDSVYARIDLDLGNELKWQWQTNGSEEILRCCCQHEILIPVALVSLSVFILRYTLIPGPSCTDLSRLWGSSQVA